MFRGAVLLCLCALVACASSDVAQTVDATEVDAETDAPTDAGIDALDACVPAAELCNGRDEDCDTEIDEDFTTLGTECMAGSGACTASGVFECDEDGTGVRCSAMPGTGGAESCNGINDDCDGTTDEGFGLGVMCDGNDADQCQEGMVVCAAAGGGTTCSDVTGDSVETCNGMNDDCDGATDEGFNLGTMCDGGDSDACIEGQIVCAAGGGTQCNDTTSSTVETCNGVDDDCRNGIDDGFAVGGACAVGVGQCLRSGNYVCNAGGTGVQCNVAQGTPSAETCGDGIDQDCNGSDATCPTNDTAAGAINISAGGVFTVDLTAANNNQDFSGTGCGLTGGRDVYYTFTLPAAEVVYVDTFGSNFDTSVRIFAGSCTSLGANQVCFDDRCNVTQSQGAIQLAAGTYCLVLDQYASTQTAGNASLTFTRGGRTGTAISAPGSGTINATTVGAANASAGTCTTTGSSPDVGYWFLVCPSTTRTVAANTCASAASWDSVLYLEKAPSATDLVCNDDSTTTCGTASPIRLSSFSGASAATTGLFWLIVDGFNGASGAYSLSYTIN
jgi:hypothetical protein